MKKEEVNYDGLKTQKAFKERWSIRLLPDYARLICYTQFEFNGEKYLQFTDKVVYVKLERWFKTYLFGKKKLFAIMANVKYLNPNLTIDELTFWCGYIIGNHFDEPFDEETISEVVNWVTKKFESNELKPNGDSRRIIFNPGIYISPEEKSSLKGKLTSKASAISEQMLYECIEQMQNRDIPFTLKDIAVEMQISLATVKRNMTKILIDFMKEINGIIRDNRDLNKLENTTAYFNNKGVKFKISELRKRCGFSGKRLKYLLNLKKGQN